VVGEGGLPASDTDTALGISLGREVSSVFVKESRISRVGLENVRRA